MNLIKISLLNWTQALEHRSRGIVYFLITVLNAGIMILFWYGVNKSNPTLFTSQQSMAINTYYLLYIIFGVLLISHISDEVGNEDIKEGQLSNYLLKPVSYYYMKFFREIPYRILQGIFGTITFLTAFILFGNIFSFSNSGPTVLFGVIIMMLAFMLSFTFKMIIGIIAFWVTDIGGILELVDIIFILFTGNLIPFYMLPENISKIMELQPLAYMIYFPILAMQGQLPIDRMLSVIGLQLMWLIIFGVIYRIMWVQGVKKYSGVGR